MNYFGSVADEDFVLSLAGLFSAGLVSLDFSSPCEPLAREAPDGERWSVA